MNLFIIVNTSLPLELVDASWMKEDKKENGEQL